jgi:hypothetical protein
MPKLLNLCDCGSNDKKSKRIVFNSNAKNKGNPKSNSLLARLFNRISK